MREGEMGNSTATTGIGVDDFAAVYDRHRGRVYAQCLRRLRSPADADDATQVTFLRAFTAMNRGSGPRRLGPWLSTIARNECCDRLSSSNQAVPMDMSELPLADDGPAPDAGVLAEAEGAEVRAAMEQLPFAQRSVLHLREVDELSYAEVAERLAMPVTAVETLLFRARTNLREEVLAVRSPVKCHHARQLGEAVRDGDAITSLERKMLRNHRSECALCTWLPVRRARGARAAAVLVVTAAAASARRLIVAPVADALVSAGAPAKTAAVAVAAGSVAAGGLAVESPQRRAAPDRPAAQVREAAPAGSASRSPEGAPPRRPRRGPGRPSGNGRGRPPPAWPRTLPGPPRCPRGGSGGAPAETAPAVEREQADRPARRPAAPERRPARERQYSPPVRQQAPARHRRGSGRGRRRPPRRPGQCVKEGASGPGPAPSGGEPGAHSVTTG